MTAITLDTRLHNTDRTEVKIQLRDFQSIFMQSYLSTATLETEE